MLVQKITVITRTYRNLYRYRQILAALLKYGFGDIVDMLNLKHYFENGIWLFSKKKSSEKTHPIEKLTRASRIRMAFEELGPTFIKLGQALSTRPDLIPIEFLTEFAKFQDKVQPCDFKNVEKILRAELPDNTFSLFEKKPIASASIGQVHRAMLAGGREVAVKVQRPGIRKIVEVDLEILLHLATLAENHIEEIRIHRPVKIIEEFARTMEREMDYSIEAGNMERFASQFENEPNIYVPELYREFSTRRVLTMEFVHGIKVSDFESLEKAGLDRRKITERGANLLLKQVFEHGFFHADPHPGNIFVLPGHVICWVDFGMMGTMTRKTGENFVNLMESIVARDATAATTVLLRITAYDEEPDLRRLERDVGDFMGQHLYKALKDLELGKLFQNLMEMVSRHKLYVPPDLFLAMKALATIEGVARSLDPNFDIMAPAIPFIRNIKAARLQPKRIFSDIFHFASGLVQIPESLLMVLQRMQRDRFKINMKHQGLDKFRSTLERTVNRLCIAIIIAALIIGSCFIISAKIPPFLFGISFIGIVGLTTAWAMIVLLLRDMWKN